MSRCSARFVRRAWPGVSMNTAWSAPRFKTPSTRCRVVCGLSVTMLIFSPISAFSSVDLPTFGRPMIATKPQRPVSPSLGLTGQHRQHRRRRFLLGVASARSPTGGVRIFLFDRAGDDERLLVIAAAHGLHAVDRQLEAVALEPFLEAGLRIFERRRVRQIRELRREQQIDHSFCRRRAAVKKHGADQRLDRVGEHRDALRAAGAQLAGTEYHLLVELQALADARERRLPDERRARTAQVPLVVVRTQVVEPPRGREAQERVAEIFEALVVVARGAAVRERLLEQRRIFEGVAEVFLGPVGARAHFLISTCWSNVTSSQMFAMYGARFSYWIFTRKPFLLGAILIASLGSSTSSTLKRLVSEFRMPGIVVPPSLLNSSAVASSVFESFMFVMYIGVSFSAASPMTPTSIARITRPMKVMPRCRSRATGITRHPCRCDSIAVLLRSASASSTRFRRRGPRGCPRERNRPSRSDCLGCCRG